MDACVVIDSIGWPATICDGISSDLSVERQKVIRAPYGDRVAAEADTATDRSHERGHERGPGWFSIDRLLRVLCRPHDGFFRVHFSRSICSISSHKIKIAAWNGWWVEGKPKPIKSVLNYYRTASACIIFHFLFVCGFAVELQAIDIIARALSAKYAVPRNYRASLEVRRIRYKLKL